MSSQPALGTLHGASNSGHNTNLTTAHITAIHSSIDALIDNPSATDKEKAAIRTSLTEVSKAIDGGSHDVCQVNAFAQWQESIIQSLKEEREQCRAQVIKMTRFNEQLKRVVAFLQDDQATAEQITKLPQADEFGDAVWQAQVTAWQSVSQTLQKRSASQDYKATQQLSVQTTKAVADAWGVVIAAHAAKDKQKYTAAQNDLAEAYDGLDGIAIETAKMMAELAKELEREYKVAF